MWISRSAHAILLTYVKHNVSSLLPHSLPYRNQRTGHMSCFLDSDHCNSLYSLIRISRKDTLHNYIQAQQCDYKISQLTCIMEWTKTFFSLSLPYGSDTLVPPSHQYSCNSLPGPLYTCHPYSCLDSVCHSIVRTYRSFYSLCFRKKGIQKLIALFSPLLADDSE